MLSWQIMSCSCVNEHRAALHYKTFCPLNCSLRNLIITLGHIANYFDYYYSPNGQLSLFLTIIFADVMLTLFGDLGSLLFTPEAGNQTNKTMLGNTL